MDAPYREQAASDVLIVSFGTAVRGLDPVTGEIRWVNYDATTAAGGIVQVVGKRVLAGGYGEVTCIDTATGKTVWSRRIEVKGRFALIVEGDRFYVAGGGEVQCLTLAGAPLWHQPFRGEGSGNVAIALGVQSSRNDSDT